MQFLMLPNDLIRFRFLENLEMLQESQNFVETQYSVQSPFQLIILRSNYQRYSLKKSVLKDFAKFTGKYLRQSLFFNKVAGFSLQLY